MNKTDKLKQAYKDLQNGKTLQVYDKELNTTGEIWSYKPYNSNKTFIYWRHFGESANGCNINELRWIFKAIFNNFTYDYTIKNN